MLKPSVASLAILLAAWPVQAQPDQAADEVIAETLDEFSMTPSGQPVVRKRIVRTGADGNKTETETLSAPAIDADSADELPSLATVRTIIRNRETEPDALEIVARAQSITETATPDGTTRIIRIIPEGGEGGTLITITKN